MQTTLFLMQALSPLACHSGRGEGVLDLPITRDVVSGLPIVPGSSLKGVMRDLWNSDEAKNSKEVAALFGPENNEAGKHAGCTCWGDTTLLLLPVRSLFGVFSWVTAPFVLQRFSREAEMAGIAGLEPHSLQNENEAAVSSNSKVIHSDGNQSKLVLEDFVINCQTNDSVDQLACKIGTLVFPENDQEFWRVSLKERFAVISDDVFSHLMHHRTQVTTRVRIDAGTGTASDGALWTEEALPIESILWGLLQAEKPRTPEGRDSFSSASAVAKAVLPPGEDTLVQVGGNASVGHGRVRVVGCHPQGAE